MEKDLAPGPFCPGTPQFCRASVSSERRPEVLVDLPSDGAIQESRSFLIILVAMKPIGPDPCTMPVHQLRLLMSWRSQCCWRCVGIVLDDVRCTYACLSRMNA